MGLKLNKVADDIVARRLNGNLEVLKKLLADPPPASAEPARLQRHLRSVGDTSWELGFMMYQQEKAHEEIRPHLARAGEFLARLHATRPEPTEGEDRLPWYFEKTVGLVVCFCGAEERKLVANCQPWQYRHPVEPEDDIATGYMECLQLFLKGAHPSHEQWAKLLEQCRSDTASKEDRQFVLPCVLALQAVLQKLPQMFQRLREVEDRVQKLEREDAEEKVR